MDVVLRGAVTYFVVWLIFRIAGKRSLSDITTFDFVLLLIISETTQSALADSDNSLTNTFILVVTLVGLDIGLSLVKQRLPIVEHVMEGQPLILVQNGKPLREVMQKERIGEEDIMAAARELQGLERIDQIKYAILERNGGVTVIPKK